VNKNDFPFVVFVVLIVSGLIYGVTSWRVFEYKECRKVGHSKLYCVLHRGR
jgi:hypothetical protein